MKKRINEAIVVEGKDDTAAVQRAVSCVTIETHGFGMPEHIWQIIEKAYNTTGIIIFTDPDYAGEKIRRIVSEKFPQCKHAFLPKNQAMKKDNIGVENAQPQDIITALERAHCTCGQKRQEFTIEDLEKWRLTGADEAKDRRIKLGEILAIGYGNSKTFLKKLNQFGITKEEFEQKAKEL